MSIISTDTLDLSGLVPADTTVKEILKQGGIEGTGWKITLAGPGHEKTIAWGEEAARKALRKAEQQEAALVNGRKYKPDTKTQQEVRLENVKWVVARVVGWSPAPNFGNGPIEFSDEAATKLFMDPRMAWAFSQIVEWLGDERTFTKASAEV